MRWMAAAGTVWWWCSFGRSGVVAMASALLSAWRKVSRDGWRPTFRIPVPASPAMLAAAAAIGTLGHEFFAAIKPVR